MRHILQYVIDMSCALIFRIYRMHDILIYCIYKEERDRDERCVLCLCAQYAHSLHHDIFSDFIASCRKPMQLFDCKEKEERGHLVVHSGS